MDKAIVIGGGGHAKVVMDIMQRMGNYELVGFTDNEEQPELCGVPYLGNDSILPTLLNKGVTHFCVGIGDNRIRKKLFYKLLSIGLTPVNVISPNAYISPYAKLGHGIVIMPGVVVNSHSVIADNVIINTLSGVDHDCRVSSHAHIAPGVSLTGNVIVGEGAFLGTGSKVIPGVCIGEWSTIGAGAVVLSDVPSETTVVGVPADKIINRG
ncbi:acetyltransferase [Paenibacillus barengoltzii]|uniref:acetyltransferase n=1 Tax=Paenibacillus barengoltzii TaxID=343517 RepID=UPI002DB5C881|nr:acetyltransferase [Paenibacillus barengoltzii]MEC2346211.1 acetyltransferase [Paenibacillus barengoltzii]